MAAVFPFGGQSEMHVMVREFAWGKTSIGPSESWPQSLRATITTLLGSRYPMILLWGPELLQIYNEAYIRLIGNKHPGALGRSIRETQAESWGIIGPMIHEVMSTGVPNWVPAQRLPLERSGYREESYFSLSYSAVDDDRGQVSGMLCVCSEVTQQVLGERRLELLRDLAVEAGETHLVDVACQDITAAISEHALDVPFAALYLCEPDGETLALHGSVGLLAGGGPFPASVDLRQAESSSQAASMKDATSVFRRALAGEKVELQGLASAGLVGGPWQEPVDEALALPLDAPAQKAALGVLLVGKSPNRALDEGYRSFYQLLGGQVSMAIRNARAHEDERKRAEALAELDRAKTAFFSNISHEFRTPLTLILGPVEDALRQGSKSLRGADLEAVHASALRLLRLVNSLLDFSRLEAGRLQSAFEPTDLALLTADLASSFRSLVERAGLRLVVDCPPLPNPIDVDRAQWEKIVMNLLSNAFKFTFSGQITVSLALSRHKLSRDGVSRDGVSRDQVELRVSDTGTGIPSVELPLIFERFHRVQSARGRSFEGTGIGLSLVAELAQQHGGGVRVESVEGEGSTFTVSIPAEQARRAPALPAGEGAAPAGNRAPSVHVLEAAQWLDKSAEASASASLGSPELSNASPGGERETDGGRVLIADDNADLRDYLARLLGKHWDVEAVSDGAAALASARERRPDLVISDVMMPRLDGFGLLRELRNDPKTSAVPVILLSARAGEESVLEGLDTGADDYLVKPFSARELLTRVRTQLAMARLRRAVAEAEERQRGQSMLRFLADASTTLAESLDYPTTLAQVARLAVPILADWCFIDIVNHAGDIVRVEVAHADPADAELAAAIKAFPAAASDNRENPPTRALLDGHSVLVENVSDELMQSSSHNEQHLAVMRKMGIRSFMSVPLRARGRILGTLSLGISASGRRYASSDLAAAEDLARRCALAVDNAGLYMEAQSAISARDQFLSIASHELRTPLTPLQLQIHTLQRRVSDVAKDDSAAEWLNGKLVILRRQSERLDRLVTELLDVTRITGAQLFLHPEWLNLEDVIREVLARFEETGELSRSGCRVELDAGPGVAGYWDRLRIDQVVTNLLENALKFGRGKPIAISLAVDGPLATLVVSDQGFGIAPADQSRVFERFERAVPEQHYGGLGLGLWIVRSILEAMGGRIKVQSSPQRGATFVVELPVIELAREEQGGQERSAN